MRKLFKYVLAALAGYIGATYLAMRQDIQFNYKTQGRYKVDPSAQTAWGIFGAGLAVILVLLRPFWLPVFRFAVRHPKLSSSLGLSVLFGLNWVVFGAAATNEKDLESGSGMAQSPSLQRRTGFRPSSDGPLGLDVFADLGGRGRRCREPLSEGARFDALGARTEQRMLAEYRETGQLPGPPGPE
jgi:hypothetical protein